MTDFISVFICRNIIRIGSIYLSRLCLIVDNGHLSLPLAPCAMACDQIRHEVAYVNSTGRARIEYRASKR